MAQQPPLPSTQSETDRASGDRIPPWGSLAFSQFRLLWGGFVFAAVGQQMREAVNLWLIWELTGSALQLGLLGAFRAVPLIVLGLFGGALADAVDRKKLLFATQSFNMTVAIALAWLALSGSIQVWHIYAVTFLGAGVMVFDQPARIALIPALVPRSHLMNAITLNTAIRHSSMLFGPSLGGFVIAYWGAEAAYGFNAVGFVPVLLALVYLRVPKMVGGGRRRFSLHEMLAGFRFIWSTRLILSFIVMDSVTMLLTSYQTLTPVFADILGQGEIGYGFLRAAPAAGFVVGTAGLLLAGDVRRKGLIVIVSTLLYAGAIALFAVSNVFLLSLLLIAAIGGFDAIGTVLRQTTLQILVPEEIRGRATAVLHVVSVGAPSLGQVVTGALAAAVTAPVALLIGGAGVVVTVFAVAARWREVVTFRG